MSANTLKDLLSVPNILDEETIHEFKAIHITECEEVLDNLGYITIEKDKEQGPQKVDHSDLIAGIKQFRTEFKTHKNKFKKEYHIPVHENDTYLTEDELDFFDEICSLEGKFPLHTYSKQQIKDHPVLTRILNYRLHVLAIFIDRVNTYYVDETDYFLDKIGNWCGENDHNKIIELIGNIELLSNKLVEQKNFKTSKFKHTIYFNNQVNTKEEKKFRFSNDMHRFESRFAFYPAASKNAFKKIGKDKEKIKAVIYDELNQLMIRVVQLRFWLLGLYQGKLDNELGPLSLNAIYNAIELYQSTYGNSKGFSINDIMTYMRNDNWAINSVFLIKGFLPHLGNGQCNHQAQTISEELHVLYNRVNDSEKETFIKEVHQIIEEKKKIKPDDEMYRKTKNRGVQQIYRSISRFIRQLVKDIKYGIQKVIDKLKALFNWVKNGVNILFRELKKAFNLLTAGVEFFFSERNVQSVHGQSKIATNYDFDFDNVTTITNYEPKLLEAQAVKCNYIATALEEVAEFLGTVVHIILKAVSGPYGWIQLAIEIIKWLADHAFSYNRFSFEFGE